MKAFGFFAFHSWQTLSSKPGVWDGMNPLHRTER